MATTATTVTETAIVSEETYRRLSLSDPDGPVELWDGRLREKPAMSVEHGDGMVELVHMLRSQLDRKDYRMRANHARLRRSSRTYFIPDVAVVPADAERAPRQRPMTLDAYPDPIPLVAEIWSPSTGDYDIAAKLPVYQQRGDLEVWCLHPYERTLTAWVRRPDGGYDETVYRGGIVRPTALPGVDVDLDALLAP